MPKIVDWYMQGKIQIDPMITHVMPLAEINNAFELMKRGESIRGDDSDQEGSLARWSNDASPRRRAMRPPRAILKIQKSYHSSGQGSTIFQRSPPFLIFFISVVSPPLRRIQSFTGVRIIGHQVRRPLGTGDLDAEGEGLVVIGLVEADAGLRASTQILFIGTMPNTSVQAGIADAIDDDALLAVADALVLGLVLLDIAAVVARVMCRSARAAARHQDERDQQSEGRDAHGQSGSRISLCQTRDKIRVV